MSLFDPASTILVAKGETKILKLTVTQEDNSPLDLTGAVLYMTVKRFQEDATIIFTKRSTDPLQIAITRPRHGEAEIYILSGDTRGLSAVDYVYDIWVVLTGDRRYPVILPGLLTITQPITTIP